MHGCICMRTECSNDTGLMKRDNHQTVVQVDYKGDVVKVFKSITEASDVSGVNRGCIHHAIHGTNASKGYRWFQSVQAYEKEKQIGTLLKTFYKVIQSDKEGHILAVYDNYPAANNATGASVSNISRACKTGYMAEGFRWFQSYHDYLTAFPEVKK